jgi:hypothetical protein
MLGAFIAFLAFVSFATLSVLLVPVQGWGWGILGACVGANLIAVAAVGFIVFRP